MDNWAQSIPVDCTSYGRLLTAVQVIPEFESGLICHPCMKKVTGGDKLALVACADGIFVVHKTCAPNNPPLTVET